MRTEVAIPSPLCAIPPHVLDRGGLQTAPQAGTIAAGTALLRLAPPHATGHNHEEDAPLLGLVTVEAVEQEVQVERRVGGTEDSDARCREDGLVKARVLF